MKKNQFFKKDCYQQTTACSVGWFVSLLVRLREREVLLAGSDEQCFCEEAGQPSEHAASAWCQVLDHALH